MHKHLQDIDSVYRQRLLEHAGTIAVSSSLSGLIESMSVSNSLGGALSLSPMMSFDASGTVNYSRL